MRCPNCHTSNRDAAKFCDYCGMELPTVAPDAYEMFDGAETGRLQGQTTRLEGIDRINDSSYSPGSTHVAPPLAQGAAADPRAFIVGSDQDAAQGVPARPSPAGHRARVIIIGVLCALVAALAIAGITYSAELWGGKVVPDVVGMESSSAASALSDAGFQVDRKLVKSDEVEDIVLACSPEAGSRIAEGSVVTLEVSTSRLVPDVLGKLLPEAQEMLAAEGLTSIEYREVKSNEPEGEVLKVSPEPGTRSRADAKVTLEVAVPFRVPEVVGAPEEQAVSALEAEGYVVSLAYVYAEDAVEGCAVGTDPAAGTVLASGSPVTLNIAKHRSSDLVPLTLDYLKSLKNVSIQGQSYEVTEVRDVRYDGGNTCAYSIAARPYETHSWFGVETETRYGNVQRIDGTITWNDDNSMASSDPEIKRI